jgi:hypothetical protein
MLEALVSKADYVTPVPDFHGQPEKNSQKRNPPHSYFIIFNTLDTPPCPTG